MQREMQLQEQRRLLREQAETRRLFQEDAEVRLARMVRVARRRELPQRQAFETHVLERQQQQQAESVEEDAEEDAWSNLIPKPLVAANNNKRSELVPVMRVLLGDVGEEFHAGVGRTQQGFDTIDFESTQMHARLNCRHCCAVDPS